MSGSTTPVTFNYDGKIDTYTAPTAGLYDIVAFSAGGGNGSDSNGGMGAEVGGDFTLTAGENLSIVVGGAGTSETYAAGGVRPRDLGAGRPCAAPAAVNASGVQAP